MSSTLELSGLSCRRGRRVLFQGLTRAVPSGRLLRVEGANGAGKTSLLRMIAGLLPPTEGDIRWQGQPTRALGEDFQDALVYAGHAAALKDDLSALENLSFALRLSGEDAKPDDMRAALRDAGLGARFHLPVRVLSQGQRKRAVLARLVLCAHRPLWILDEPFNALDQGAIGWLLDLIRAHVAAQGLVVMTSHQPLALDAAAEDALVL